jgi:hypothetical protein
MAEGRFAGVDWASEEHAVCVVDEQGRIVEGRRFKHTENGLRALCVRLAKLEVRLVAIERPDGLLIERLLDAGLTVIAVHPNQVRAAGPRYSVAHGKSDSFDSFVLAELARTDSHRFRVLAPDSDRTKALRALTRSRQDLVRTRIAANQLRDQLACFWPGASKVFNAVDSKIALAFLRRYPTPANAPSPTNPGNPGAPPSAGRVTTAYAKRSTCSRTQAADTTPGHRTSTPEPEPAALATPTPPASSDAPGAKSSGASGTTTTPTTRPNTPPDNDFSRPRVDTGGLEPRVCS